MMLIPNIVNVVTRVRHGAEQLYDLQGACQQGCYDYWNIRIVTRLLSREAEVVKQSVIYTGPCLPIMHDACWYKGNKEKNKTREETRETSPIPLS